MLRAIQRHRDVYQDYSREFRRTKVRMPALSTHVLFVLNYGASGKRTGSG